MVPRSWSPRSALQALGSQENTPWDWALFRRASSSPLTRQFNASTLSEAPYHTQKSHRWYQVGQMVSVIFHSM